MAVRPSKSAFLPALWCFPIGLATQGGKTRLKGSRRVDMRAKMAYISEGGEIPGRPNLQEAAPC